MSGIMGNAPFSCGTCRATFGSLGDLRGHRAEIHPELEAGAIALIAALNNGATEEEAAEIGEKAIREYREAVQA